MSLMPCTEWRRRVDTGEASEPMYPEVPDEGSCKNSTRKTRTWTKMRRSSTPDGSMAKLSPKRSTNTENAPRLRRRLESTRHRHRNTTRDVAEQIDDKPKQLSTMGVLDNETVVEAVEATGPPLTSIWTRRLFSVEGRSPSASRHWRSRC
jgi:hypothetical protein